MITFENSQVDEQQVLRELIDGEGVVLVKNVYSQSQINEAREIVNKYADTQEQKETHFNAEASTAESHKVSKFTVPVSVATLVLKRSHLALFCELLNSLFQSASLA